MFHKYPFLQILYPQKQRIKETRLVKRKIKKKEKISYTLLVFFFFCETRLTNLNEPSMNATVKSQCNFYIDSDTSACFRFCFIFLSPDKDRNAGSYLSTYVVNVVTVTHANESNVGMKIFIKMEKVFKCLKRKKFCEEEKFYNLEEDLLLLETLLQT